MAVVPTDTPPSSLRFAFVASGIGLWFLSQSLIKSRPVGSGSIIDGLHVATAFWTRWLNTHPKWADRLLILSSLGIDVLGGFVMYQSIFGPSFQPFLGVLILFALRQVCQMLCALPIPEGMIWRSPGVPSLLVTYGVANDLFFSGHTAMAVYGAIELGRWGGGTWIVVGAAVAVFEMATVIVLRAHYTMDVYAGAVSAVLAAYAAEAIGPACDAWLVHLGQFIW